MTEKEWNTILRVINGKAVDPLPVGFIIDSPWLPGWHGISTLDYYTSDSLWFKANRKAIETFPDVIFLPGFWAEYGMCTEPSAFGAKCRWETESLPHANALTSNLGELSKLEKPNVRKDGLLPFVINRLSIARPQIQDMGHEIKFAVARGPLNIASFLMGTTELMMALVSKPENCHRFIGTISDFLTDWIGYQMEQFPSIDGILLLDDMIGFLGDEHCREFVVPYFKRIYGAFSAKINFLHNDAAGLVSAPFLLEMGVNLFNFSFEHSISEIRKLAGDGVTLLGGVPPRDVLAGGTPDEVDTCVREMLGALDDNTRLIPSAGGGMPPGVSTENIKAFLHACAEAKPGI